MTQTSSNRRALVVSQTSISPFGRKLVQMGIASDAQLQSAFETHRETGKSLAVVIEEITGNALPPELQRLYKRQELFELKILHGIPTLDIELDPVDIDRVTQLLETLLPIDICSRYRLLPVSQEDNVVSIAMVEPENLRALDDLNRRLQSQNLTLKRFVVTPGDMQALTARCLDIQADALSKQAVAQQEVVVSGKIDDIDLEGLEDGPDEDAIAGVSLEQQARSAEDAPVIKLANQILVKALQEGTSDIHVEPQETHLRIRFRKDGVLQQAFDDLPLKIIPALTARFKIISDLDIAERRMPQDGRIRRVFKGRKVDFRVSTLPSRYGEKIVLRILDNSATQLGLDKLITDPDTLGGVKEMVAKPFGLILVTGPTGSGKTTTLYSALSERNDPDINISTAEDPIEYSLPGITQVQVIREKGMDFAMILRAFLRQDPDVILVGETRDLETAKTAIEASLTGHLVLTTLHTNDAPGAIARLTEMGIEPFMISSSLLGVLAQRLMRRVCSECRIPYHPAPEELAHYGLVASGSVEDITFYKPNTLTPKEIEQRKAMNQHICPKCSGVGYKGRVGVYEFMRMNDTLAELINKDAPTEAIKEAAVESGMKTLLAYSLQLVQQGMTTLEEVNRVTLTDKGLESELKQRSKSISSCNSCGAELQLDWMDCPYCLTPRF